MARASRMTLFDSSKEYVVASDGTLPRLDGSNLYNVHTVYSTVDLTYADSEAVSWDQAHAVATVTHGMSCMVLVQVHTGDGELVQPDVSVLDADTVALDFGEDPGVSETVPWRVDFVYAGEYGTASPVDYIGLCWNYAALCAQVSQEALDRLQAAEDAQTDVSVPVVLSGASGTVEPGKTYTLEMAEDFTLSAAELSGGRYGEAVVFVTPGEHAFSVADGIRLDAEMDSFSTYRLFVSWTPVGVLCEQTGTWLSE